MNIAHFVELVVARLRETPVNLTGLPPESIPGSLHSGAAGVAFFLHEAARLSGEEALLEPAHQWYEAARAWADHATRSDWQGLARGFLIGETGLSYVDALLAARHGDRARVLRAVERIARVSDRFDDLRQGLRPTELLAGAAGVACATRDLEARLPGSEHEASRNVLRRVRAGAATSLMAAYATALDPGADDLLGFAHGLAGELWALAAVVGVDHDLVRARLSEFAALREIDDEGLVYWRPHRGKALSSFLGTWCNGMPGQTLLFCEVARQTRSPEWSRLAGLAAQTTDLFGGTNPSLCCGLAGQSVALHRYAELSGDARMARSADDRLTRAAEISSAAAAQFLGLWQGVLGVALVAMSRLHGEGAIPCLGHGSA